MNIISKIVLSTASGISKQGAKLGLTIGEKTSKVLAGILLAGATSAGGYIIYKGVKYIYNKGKLMVAEEKKNEENLVETAKDLLDDSKE